MNIEGRCINFGSCESADSKKLFPMARGVDAFCPDCGARLFPVTPPGPNRLKFALFSIGVTAVAIAVIVFVGLSRRSPPVQVAASASPSPSPSAPASVSPALALRLCGSNVMGERLAPLLLQAFLMRSAGAGAAPPDEHDVQKAIASGDTAAAFSSLATKACDVGLASRQITPGEQTRLRALGDMSSRDAEHVIGLDGITILVNRANPVSALSVAQLRSIFAGSISNWSAVHGASGPMHVYAPSADSGTVDAFYLLVMDKARFGRSVNRSDTFADVASAVAGDKQGIGFVVLPYADRAKALKISSGVMAMAPNQLTVGRETYPLSRRLYLYTPVHPANPATREFVKFAQSDPGQLLVDRAGFVGTTSQPPSPPPVSIPPGAPKVYVQIARGSRQSGFVFYFKTGSDALDNKAYDDIARLVAAMSSREHRDQQIILAGFADSTGTHAANKALSERRAHSVEHELLSRGVKVQKALGFGDAMPIRDNSTEQGREKNRRVEIFTTFKASK